MVVLRGDLDVVQGSALQVGDVAGRFGRGAAGVVSPAHRLRPHVVTSGAVRLVEGDPGRVGDAVQVPVDVGGDARS